MFSYFQHQILKSVSFAATLLLMPVSSASAKTLCEAMAPRMHEPGLYVTPADCNPDSCPLFEVAKNAFGQQVCVGQQNCTLDKSKVYYFLYKTDISNVPANNIVVVQEYAKVAQNTNRSDYGRVVLSRDKTDLACRRNPRLDGREMYPSAANIVRDVSFQNYHYYHKYYGTAANNDALLLFNEFHLNYTRTLGNACGAYPKQ